jgi:hypothetical protein
MSDVLSAVQTDAERTLPSTRAHACGYKIRVLVSGSNTLANKAEEEHLCIVGLPPSYPTT